MLKPTLDVEVAVALILSPARVVVPKPSVETERRFFVVEPTANPMRSPAWVSTPSRALGEVEARPTKPLPSTNRWVAEDEPIENSGTPEPKAFGLIDSWAQGVDVPSPSLLLVSSQKKLAGVADCDSSPDPVDDAKIIPPL